MTCTKIANGWAEHLTAFRSGASVWLNLSLPLGGDTNLKGEKQMFNPQELRLECVKLALSKSDTVEDAVKAASLLEGFVQGPSHSQPCNTDDTE